MNLSFHATICIECMTYVNDGFDAIMNSWKWYIWKVKKHVLLELSFSWFPLPFCVPFESLHYIFDSRLDLFVVFPLSHLILQFNLPVSLYNTFYVPFLFFLKLLWPFPLSVYCLVFICFSSLYCLVLLWPFSLRPGEDREGHSNICVSWI